MLYPADQAAGAVFTTRQHDVVWVLTTYHESALRIGYVVVWPGMCATKLDIALQATPDGTTEAAVTYRRTALSEAGDAYVKDFSRDFPGQREHWEQAIGSPLRELRKR